MRDDETLQDREGPAWPPLDQAPLPRASEVEPDAFYDEDPFGDDADDEEAPRPLQDLLAAWNGGGPLYLSYNHVGRASTAVVGSQVHDGVHTESAAKGGYAPRVRAGLVRAEEVDFVERHFADPPGYHQVLKRLRDGLLLLVGRPGSGRRTTAVHLLIDCETQRIVALEPEYDLTRLTGGDLRKGTGYLLELPDPALLEAYGPAEIAFLADELKDAGAHLVVTAPNDGAPPSGWQTYLCPGAPPEPTAVLSQFLTEHIGRTWQADHPGLVDDAVRDMLGACRGPSEAASLALDLIGVAHGRYDKQRLLADSGAQGRRAVADWFAAHQEPEAWAFVLAAAVFEGHDYSVIAERARVLGGYLRRLEDFSRPPGTASTGQNGQQAGGGPVSRSTWLQTIGADLDIGDEVETRHSVRYRIEPVRFVRLHWATTILEHAWREYPVLRQPLMAWLADTPTHRSAHLVAGMVAGRLLGSTRGYRPLAPLSGWTTRDRHRREMAASALGVAAEDEITATQVRRLLSRWSRADAGAGLRLTAALAYGGSFGASYPDLALKRLVKLAGTAEPEVASAAAEGIVRLCRTAVDPAEAIRYLRVSVENGDGTCGAVATSAAVLLAGTTSDRRRGPTAEAVHLLNTPEGRQETISLLRTLCTDPQGYPAVVDVITTWLRGGTMDERTSTSRLVADALEELFASTKRTGLERLAYDLVNLAYGGDHVDMNALQPAIQAFEDPLPLRTGGIR
ncbi:hypothetical protein LO772_08055 [Yinghuangia sp. ASG 101]|uniref:hypothetical protein n=1 Tax=Yinghuangia sp. ASG 101 TaxID=2896848 RepID=UPI001E505001|nr:hypothetical protein [Yinghuangia sp. ASG 101]UGQ13547.1 hypothetical protein LO772_08055 [Yinghuangia sp. ASG 101]